MSTTRIDNLFEIAQEIADRYGAKNLGVIETNDGRVHFRRKPFNQEEVIVTLTYAELKEHFNYDYEKDKERELSSKNVDR